MPARAAPHYIAAIRAWFGLSLGELADYAGVRKQFLASIEAHQRPLPTPLSTVLLPLLLALPSPEVQAAAAARQAADDAPESESTPRPGHLAPRTSHFAPLPAPDHRALDVRRRICLASAARLRAEAARLARQARVAARWAAALPALLPPDPAAPAAPPLPNPTDPAADPAARALAAALALPPNHDPLDPTVADLRRCWLRLWLTRHARPLPPAAATRYHQLRARAAGLHAEAEALAAALAGA